jgi:outer membrane protein assembly factor BamB
MVAAIVVPCLGWTLARTGGFDGSFDNDLAWRWSETAEDRLLSQSETLEVVATNAPVPVASPAPTAPVPAPASSVDQTAAARAPSSEAASADRAPDANPAAAAGEAIAPRRDWPGFRGTSRDGIVRGVRINTDWTAAPPVQLWRRAIGPGWSSFAVHGDLLFTQEQRGEDEIVSAYRVSTGAPVWRHRDAARFYESNGGPGPRGTPTFSEGRIYTFGATGILNALDANDGRLVWSRNVGADSGITIPDWGFASSPLLTGDLVIVAAAGKLVAYQRTTGTPRWFGPDGGPGYSSPHLATIDGVPQILLLNGGGVTSVATADGAKLWEMTVVSSGMSSPIVQPAFTADGDLLLGDGVASALRRVAVTRSSGVWTVEERWKSTGLKPLFNDFVVHQGYAFGFDGTILACVDVNDGTRKWKAGRYGAGQMLLLEDQSVLVVVSEEGGLALVAASAEKFTELARIPAIEGKTWNHPVVAGDVLLVRNGEEMAAFKLPVVSR